MTSAYIVWKGSCSAAADGDDLLSHVTRLAEINHDLLAGDLPDNRPAFPQTMTTQRGEGLKQRANGEVVEQEIAGKIVLDANLIADEEQFAREAARLRLPLLGDDGGEAREIPSALHILPRQRLLLCVDAAQITGVNFRLYNPRSLYPGEDRASFVFLQCSGARLSERQHL